MLSWMKLLPCTIFIFSLDYIFNIVKFPGCLIIYTRSRKWFYLNLKFFQKWICFAGFQEPPPKIMTPQVHYYIATFGRCVCVCVCVCVCSVARSCLTLCNPLDCSPLGSSVHGISPARILEWVAISYSRGSSWPRDQTCVSCISCIGRQSLYHWVTWEVYKYTYIPSF